MYEDYPLMKGHHAEVDLWSYLHPALQLPPLPLDSMALSYKPYLLTAFPSFTLPSCSLVALFVLHAPCPSPSSPLNRSEITKLKIKVRSCLFSYQLPQRQRCHDGEVYRSPEFNPVCLQASETRHFILVEYGQVHLSSVYYTSKTTLSLSQPTLVFHG